MSQAALFDQQAIAVCLAEVARCQRISPRPSFVVLLGNRYGARPLPADIPSAVFDRILDHATENAPDAALTLREWYPVEDLNAVPAGEVRPGAYLLKPRGEVAPDTWSRVEAELLGVIEAATVGLFDGLDGHDKAQHVAKYGGSATEQEIREGLAMEDAAQHVHCFFRDIESLPMTAAARDFADLIPSESTPSGYMVDEAARRRLDSVRTDLELGLPGNVHRYTALWNAGAVDSQAIQEHLIQLLSDDGWRNASPEDQRDRILQALDGDVPPSAIDAVRTTFASDDGGDVSELIGELRLTLLGGPTRDHLTQLCEDMRDALWAVIEPVLAKREDVGAIGHERQLHATFAAERSEDFIGRSRELRAIVDYMAGSSRSPLGVHGEPGAGKSALMAKATQLIASQQPGPKIVVRFIGTTRESFDGRALLSSLCRDIDDIYDGTGAPLRNDYEGLVQEFPQHLAKASADRPLVIFLDALDQLADTDHAAICGGFQARCPTM